MANGDVGPLGPLAVAAVVIVYLVLVKPLSGDLAGVSLNWIASIVVATGGLAGALQ